MEPIIELDERGNVTHCRDSDGDEWWRGYDKNGNMTHIRSSYGHN